MKKKKVLVQVLIAAIIILFTIGFVFCFVTPRVSDPSGYMELSLNEVVVQTEKMQYEPTVKEILITVKNRGQVLLEFGHPQLEIQNSNTWYSLYRGKHSSTDNLLTVDNGEMKQFSLFTEQYGIWLKPGHYRVVFPIVGSIINGANCVFAEFDIV